MSFRDLVDRKIRNFEKRFSPRTLEEKQEFAYSLFLRFREAPNLDEIKDYIKSKGYDSDIVIDKLNKRLSEEGRRKEKAETDRLLKRADELLKEYS